ncbi:MAG: cytochrome b6-f complex subunit PetL [Acaryochloridaceae cyanobacterium SU_2_1]|nr:cytochrome b6-f complex subunit PetL [Acaryochloridaceae cyanobacterium SU_2_1]NJM95466.1 cytochrome b6-f complex subunit PetL [Acaryochloridaceae cyanobacterium CSU_5_19]
MGFIAYILFISVFIGMALGLYFGLKAVKII